MFKFRDDIELIKCNLRDFENPPEGITDIQSRLDGFMGPWPTGTAMVDNSDFPGPIYRNDDGTGKKHAEIVYDGDYLVKVDGHIFYVPLTLFVSLLKEIDDDQS